MKEEEIELTLDELVNIIYDYTLINSLVFSVDIEQFIKNNLKIDYLDKAILLRSLHNYLAINKDRNIFDSKVKDNCYFLIDYIDEEDNKMERLEKNSIINEIKINLNNASSSNFDFLREQILLRDYGKINYNRKWTKLNKMLDQIICDYRDIYYDSISNDFFVMNLLLMEEQKFYNQEYKLFLLCKDFYRSINYFAATYSFLFHSSDWLNRIKFIMDKDLRLLTNLDDETNIDLVQGVDDEFFDIVEVTHKLVKRFNGNRK